MFEMTQRQTPTDTTQSFIEMEADGSINLAGRHTARIFQVKRVVSPKGTPYHEVGVEIVIGRAKGRVVFAKVFGREKQGRPSPRGWVGARLDRASAPRG